jgi:hypothetical protein
MSSPSPYSFRIPLTPPPHDYREYPDPETIVEQSGWRSTDKIVASLQDAGSRLQAYRKSEFDMNSDIGDNEDFPEVVLRTPEVDFTDVDNLRRQAVQDMARARQKQQDAVSAAISSPAPTVPSAAAVSEKT